MQNGFFHRTDKCSLTCKDRVHDPERLMYLKENPLKCRSEHRRYRNNEGRKVPRFISAFLHISVTVILLYGLVFSSFSRISLMAWRVYLVRRSVLCVLSMRVPFISVQFSDSVQKPVNVKILTIELSDRFIIISLTLKINSVFRKKT